jgi:hypothetical protein
MVGLLMVCALLVQGDARKLNEHVEQRLLAVRMSVSFKDVPLTQWAAFVESMVGEALPFYIDPAEVKEPDKVTISASENDKAAGDVLKSSLATRGLAHRIWNGVIVVTTEKGAKEFDKPDWCGLDLKALADRKALVAELNTAHTFEWSPFDPRKAVEVLAKESGVAIDAGALASMKPSEENEYLLFPRKTTLFGALACLSRSTGITFEATKDGKLVARPPKEKK